MRQLQKRSNIQRLVSSLRGVDEAAVIAWWNDQDVHLDKGTGTSNRNSDSNSDSDSSSNRSHARRSSARERICELMLEKQQQQQRGGGHGGGEGEVKGSEQRRGETGAGPARCGALQLLVILQRSAHAAGGGSVSEKAHLYSAGLVSQLCAEPVRGPRAALLAAGMNSVHSRCREQLGSGAVEVLIQTMRDAHQEARYSDHVTQAMVRATVQAIKKMCHSENSSSVFEELEFLSPLVKVAMASPKRLKWKVAGILNRVTAARPRVCALLVANHWNVVTHLIRFEDKDPKADAAKLLVGANWGVAIIRNLCKHALAMMDLRMDGPFTQKSSFNSERSALEEEGNASPSPPPSTQYATRVLLSRRGRGSGRGQGSSGGSDESDRSGGVDANDDDEPEIVRLVLDTLANDAHLKEKLHFALRTTDEAGTHSLARFWGITWTRS